MSFFVMKRGVLAAIAVSRTAVVEVKLRTSTPTGKRTGGFHRVQKLETSREGDQCEVGYVLTGETKRTCVRREWSDACRSALATVTGCRDVRARIIPSEQIPSVL